MPAIIMTGQIKKKAFVNSFTLIRKDMNKKEEIIDHCSFIRHSFEVVPWADTRVMLILSSIIISPVVI